MLSPQEAWERIEAHLEPLAVESAPRREALGSVLAHPLEATLDTPGTDVSAMDGFATAGAISAGDRQSVNQTIAAGDPPGFELPPGTAARIMTGAPVPQGADRVVPVEETQDLGEEVVFHNGLEPGVHIRHRGEIVAKGEELLPAGAFLTPGALGLLATHGYAEVAIHRRPRVAVLATGDEVVPPETEPRPGQLRDSHTDFLLAAGRGLGLDFTPLGIAPDRREALRELIGQGLEADVLLLGGGVSKGEFDFVPQILTELGCETLVDAVAVQPGKPLVVARHQSGWVVGLPGNPASVAVCFWLFVRPLLRRLQNLEDGYWHGALAGVLASPLPGAKSRDRFLTADVSFDKGTIRVVPVLAKGSHDLAAYACGTALVRIPAGAAPSPAGRPCEILPIG